MAIKDDIDCYPHPSKGYFLQHFLCKVFLIGLPNLDFNMMIGATTWMHEVRTVRQDAICVSRLRSCGVIFVGKANMHELGMGTTGNNPNYG